MSTRAGRHRGKIGLWALAATVVLSLVWATTSNAYEWLQDRLFDRWFGEETSTAAVDVGGAVRALVSEDENRRAVAISDLRTYLGSQSATGAEGRHALDALAGFVRRTAPPLPPRSERNSYCSNGPFTGTPQNLQSALEAIGSRNLVKAIVPVDLARTNLAYLSMQGLNLRGVHFDGALLCRTFLDGSRFDKATFSEGDLRFTSFDRSLEVSPQHLRECSTLFKSNLPRALTVDARIAELQALDPIE